MTDSQAECLNEYKMNLEQARKILNVSAEDDGITIKRKYRRLIGCHHPDAVGSDRPEHMKRAQEINEAYHLFKRHESQNGAVKKKQVWQGIVNEKAFIDRNIYRYYTLDIAEKKPYYQTARGKYMWNPDEEEFELFLTSIHHVTRELLERTEEQDFSSGCEEALQEAEKFEFQVQLFSLLAAQYIDPLGTLRKIAEPDHVDRQGREIYRFRAFLGAKGQSEIWKAMALLQQGDSVCPESFQGSRIAVMNDKKQSLGHLSLEDDELYFCVIPLLKRRMARVKMTVRAVEISRKTRPHRVKADVDFLFRLEEGTRQYTDSESNLRIADLLNRYENILRQRRSM